MEEQRIPMMLYGTAWKEERTEELTTLALAAGFRGIDTANQRKHYQEVGVGAAVAKFLDSCPREELFLQTKFTYARGQDHRLPYDPDADAATQVRQSMASSLDHLHTSYIDSYVLHGPETSGHLTDIDWTVWRTMEALHAEGTARFLGISNVSLSQLQQLVQGASIPPSFVQNRCYASHQWDQAVRAFCQSRGIIYQGFSLLTANRTVWRHPEVQRIADRLGATSAQVILAFARHIGMLPLTGTTDRHHMEQDLACAQLELTANEVEQIERLGL